MSKTQQQFDRLGRATFYHIAPIVRVRPTKRELRWLKHIERHGPQSSVYLYELTKDTHRCRDTALRQMQKLRAGGYLTLPRQQRAAEHADFNPYIYDLAPKAKDYLYEIGTAKGTLRPTGHWWHAYATACVTSAINITAARSGVRYIPGHDILARNEASLAIPVYGQRLIPDQLFALDYGGRYRAFALEVDRGTEPKTSPTARKSYHRSIELYRHMIEGGLHKTHYGLKANLLVLWVFNSRRNEQRFLEMLVNESELVRKSVLTQSTASLDVCRWSRQVDAGWYEGAWRRAGEPHMRLSKH